MLIRMDLLPRAFAIGCILEVLGALPIAFGAGLGPCKVNGAGLFLLLMHVPGLFVGVGLSALLGMPDAAAMFISAIAQAFAWTALVYLILRIRLARAIRRANALPTI